MNLEVIKELKIDFYNTKYITINAKQYDIASRYILITCYNQGTVFPINNISNSAYIRYRKADDFGAFNSCEVTADGQVLVELSPQMLAVAGRCYADLIVVDNTNVEINSTTNEVKVRNANVVSSMTFCIDVSESAFDNMIIESTDEFNALNELLIKANADYTAVIAFCKEMAERAKESEENAKTSANNARKSENNAKTSETKAALSEKNAKSSETAAKTSEEKAKESETNAKISETESAQSVVESAQFATNSESSALLSKSYAVGGTDVRSGENMDNAKYYYSQTKIISDSIDSSFFPMGTVEFADLKSVEKSSGYLYHISDAFFTDDSFKEGAGVSYPSGTNVYYTYDGYWSCLTSNAFVVLDSSATLETIDDGAGTVTLLFTSSAITEEEQNEIKQTIAALQERIAILENKNVLEVTE